jgi:serine/threonine protein kinase
MKEIDNSIEYKNHILEFKDKQLKRKEKTYIIKNFIFINFLILIITIISLSFLLVYKDINPIKKNLKNFIEISNETNEVLGEINCVYEIFSLNQKVPLFGKEFMKLSNFSVYLDSKLIDFSISIDYSKINSREIKLPLNGTNLYMAPEVLSSKIIETKDLGKVDLFSLGVMLYNLAFASYPFDLNHGDSNDYKGIFNKIMNNDIEIKDNSFSPQFIDFLKKLLEKDINNRININQALNHYWVKGAKILYEEKEKLYNAGTFLSLLITDQIKEFNDYIFRLN